MVIYEHMRYNDGMGLFGKKSTEPAGASVVPTPKLSPTDQVGGIVIKLIDDGVLVVDGNKNVIFENPAAEKMTEVPRDDLLGIEYTAMVRFEDADGKAHDVVAEAALPDAPQSRRDLAVVGRQSKHKTDVDINIVRYEGGVILSMRDIGAELKKENDSSEFVSTASHEMRTPVASIEGFLGLALNPKTATIDDRARSYLEKAHAASQHLGKLFKDLLDSTKLDDGRQKLNMVPVDFAAEVKKIADIVAPTVAAKNLHYTFGGANPLNSGNTNQLERVMYAQVDVDYLSEIISNLVENAAKYTVAGTVDVTVSANEHYVMATVADTGIGIAPTDQEHIFQKFYRADNSWTRDIGGTGLGLYITMKRAQDMGGTIKLRSEVGKGSAFSLILPRLSTDQYDRLVLAQQNTWAIAKKVQQ
jgi:signal transduction histidine kinase